MVSSLTISDETSFDYHSHDSVMITMMALSSVSVTYDSAHARGAGSERM